MTAAGLTDAEKEAIRTAVNDSQREDRRRQTVKDDTRWRHEANQELKLEEAAHQIKLPPTRDSYKLSSYVAEDKPPAQYRLDRLQRIGHSVLLVAQYKTGKSTLGTDLARCLADGGYFLDEFETKPLAGCIGIWNAEMEGQDYEDYLTARDIRNTDAVAVWHLRGCRVPLLADPGADAAVNWLRESEVEYWLLDPWRNICSWSGVNEDINAEVAPLLQRVDEIKQEAGAREILISHHTGHQGDHARGATALSDWADAIWKYTRDDDDRRFFSAIGRGVNVHERHVTMDEDTGKLVYREESRKQADTEEACRQVVDAVEQHPGVKVGELAGLVDLTARALAPGRKLAEDRNLIHIVEDGPSKLLHPGPAPNVASDTDAD